MNIEVAVLKPDVRLKDFRKRKLPDDDAAYLRCGRCDRVSRSGEHFDGARARLASCHMFSKPGKMPPNLIPDGIYTIPEISMVGQTEEQLTRDKIAYETGSCRLCGIGQEPNARG